MQNEVIEFMDDDTEYLRWLNSHTEGYVLNTTRNKSPEYMVLHRAYCHSISKYSGNAKQGGFTERNYMKVCTEKLDSLRNWVKRNGRPNGTFSSECPCTRFDW